MRVIVATAIVVLAPAGCGPPDGGPADPAGPDRVLVLYFDAVLERGEEWWGYPPPGHYCVAIAPGAPGPALEESRDPGSAVLDSLGRAHPDRVFHPFSRCTTGPPLQAPDGEAAGLLWAAPVGADRSRVSGGWMADNDLTEWGCTFVETEGRVRLEACTLRSES